MESNEVLESYYRMKIAKEYIETTEYINTDVLKVILGVKDEKKEGKDDEW